MPYEAIGNGTDSWKNAIDKFSERQAKFRELQQQASAKLRYALACQIFIALMGSSSLAVAFFNSEEADLAKAAVILKLLVPSFVGSTLFALGVEMETILARQLTRGIIAGLPVEGADSEVDEENIGTANEALLDNEPVSQSDKVSLIELAAITPYAKDTRTTVTIAIVAGSLFSGLGLGTVAAEKLAAMVANEAGAIATRYLTDTAFHGIGGAVLPMLLGKCGISLSDEVKYINAVALASIMLGKAIVEFGLKPGTNPYLANLLVGSVVALVTVATIKAWDSCHKAIPGETIHRASGSFSGVDRKSNEVALSPTASPSNLYGSKQSSFASSPASQR